MALFTLPVNGPVSQGFSSTHPGIDFAVPVGTPIRAAADGIITSQGLNGDGGNTIIIQHGGGYESVYAHLSNFLLQPGTAVKQGQIIGFSGGQPGMVGAGNATGPHLHFQVDKGKGAANAVDPSSLLGLPTITPGAATQSNISKLWNTLVNGPANSLYNANAAPGTALGGLLEKIPGVKGGVTTVKDVMGGITSTGQALGWLSNPTHLKRIGTGAIGVALIVIVGAKLLNDSDTGAMIKQGIKKSSSKAATVAAVA